MLPMATFIVSHRLPLRTMLLRSLNKVVQSLSGSRRLCVNAAKDEISDGS